MSPRTVLSLLVALASSAIAQNSSRTRFSEPRLPHGLRSNANTSTGTNQQAWLLRPDYVWRTGDAVQAARTD
jgi:hypothetical protein